MGVPVEYETGVTGIVFNGSNSVTTVEMPDGASKQIEARFIIDGSGYGRVIPRLFNLDRPSSLPPRKTLFAHAQDPESLLRRRTEPNHHHRTRTDNLDLGDSLFQRCYLGRLCR
jgi:L-2-hydroxyglutarate oxidase LhgO